MPDNRSKKTFGLTVGLLVAAILLSLFVGEVVLRVFFPIDAHTDLYWLPDGRISGRYVPGQEFYTGPGYNPLLVNRAVSKPCRINKYGFRGKDYALGPNKDSVRVMFLGGSSTFNYHDVPEDTWPERLGRLLEARFGKKVEVLNFSIPGFTAENGKFNYLAYGRNFYPDIVVVYNTWNDLKEMGRIQKDPYRLAYSRVAQNGAVRLKKFMRKFQIVRRLRVMYYKYVASSSTYVHREGDRIAEVWSPSDGSWNWFQRNFKDLAMFTRADHCLLVLSSQGTLVSRENVRNPNLSQYIGFDVINMDEATLCDSFDRASGTIRAVSEEFNLPFVDVYGDVDRTIDNFEDHVHIAPHGQIAVAMCFFNVLKNDRRVRSIFADH